MGKTSIGILLTQISKRRKLCHDGKWLFADSKKTYGTKEVPGRKQQLLEVSWLRPTQHDGDSTKLQSHAETPQKQAMRSRIQTSHFRGQ